MKYTISLFLNLLLLWLLLSGHYNGLLLSFALFSCLAITWAARRMQLVDAESQPLHLLLKLPFYWLWLARAIARSNLAVIRLIIAGPKNISPAMVTVTADEKTELCQAIFANSITLTPGTVSVALLRGTIEVHALAKEDARSIQDGEMNRRISAMEGPPARSHP